MHKSRATWTKGLIVIETPVDVSVDVSSYSFKFRHISRVNPRQALLLVRGRRQAYQLGRKAKDSFLGDVKRLGTNFQDVTTQTLISGLQELGNAS